MFDIFDKNFIKHVYIIKSCFLSMRFPHFVLPGIVSAGETSEEALRRRLHEEREFRQQEIEQKRKVQKSKELERYISCITAKQYW